MGQYSKVCIIVSSIRRWVKFIVLPSVLGENCENNIEQTFCHLVYCLFPNISMLKIWSQSPWNCSNLWQFLIITIVCETFSFLSAEWLYTKLMNPLTCGCILKFTQAIFLTCFLRQSMMAGVLLGNVSSCGLFIYDFFFGDCLLLGERIYLYC